MKIRYWLCIISFMLIPLVAHSAPLGKYSDSEPRTVPQQSVSPDEVKQRLNQSMQEAINRLNAMSPEERNKWTNYYVLKMKAAQKKGNYLEAGYYSGILAGVK